MNFFKAMLTWTLIMIIVLAAVTALIDIINEYVR